MSLLKNISLLMSIISYNALHTMETTTALTCAQELMNAVAERNIEVVENLLSSYAFNFTSLAQAYMHAIFKAKKLSPNAELRRDIFMQEAIEKVRLQRKIALDKLNILDNLSTPQKDSMPGKKSRAQQIDETLIDQGKIYLLCAKKIYPHLKPLLHEKDNINIIFFIVGQTCDLDLLQYFTHMYEDFINWNYEDIYGKTLLHIAAKEGNIAMVDYLLNKKIDYDKQTYNGEKGEYPHKTALHYAAEYCEIIIVEHLLNYGSNPNLADDFGNLPLHYVAPGARNNTKIFEMLLKAGTDIDSKSYDDKTLLYKAVEANDPDAVEYLLKLKADPHLKSIKRINCQHTDQLTNNGTMSINTTINSAYYHAENFMKIVKHEETPRELAITIAIINLFNKDPNCKKNNKIILKLLDEYNTPKK